MCPAGRSGGPQAFNLESRSRSGEGGEDESEQEEEDEHGNHTERGSVGTDGTAKVEDDEKSYLLPDAAVPLGLIAKLALDSNKKKATASAKDGDETDDDNVVSCEVPPVSSVYRAPKASARLHSERRRLTLSAYSHRGSRTRRISCQVNSVRIASMLFSPNRVLAFPQVPHMTWIYVPTSSNSTVRLISSSTGW